MRSPDWPAKLAQALGAAQQHEFIWGSHDCCLFSADVALAITGVDYAASFRGRYHDQRGAIKALQEFMGTSLRDTITAIMGPEISLLHAMRGDFILANNGNGNMLGICIGETAAFLTSSGLLYLPLPKCKTAWRVE